MPIYLFSEHDNAKDEERFEKYRKFVVDEWNPYAQKILEDGICKITSLADNTGHMMGLYEFENIEDFHKIWGDPKWQSIMIKFSQLVDNSKFRLCRPGRIIEPEEVM